MIIKHDIRECFMNREINMKNISTNNYKANIEGKKLKSQRKLLFMYIN